MSTTWKEAVERRLSEMAVNDWPKGVLAWIGSRRPAEPPLTSLVMRGIVLSGCHWTRNAASAPGSAAPEVHAVPPAYRLAVLIRPQRAVSLLTAMV